MWDSMTYKVMASKPPQISSYVHCAQTAEQDRRGKEKTGAGKKDAEKERKDQKVEVEREDDAGEGDETKRDIDIIGEEWQGLSRSMEKLTTKTKPLQARQQRRRRATLICDSATCLTVTPFILDPSLYRSCDIRYSRVLQRPPSLHRRREVKTAARFAFSSSSAVLALTAITRKTSVVHLLSI